MYDLILFAVLLILIAASVALVFLILFGDGLQKNASDKLKSLNQSAAENEYNKRDD